jgi:large subunit ribosomal protein L22
MKASITRLPISSKKLNLVAGLIRRRSAADALDFLSFLPKKAARFLQKLLASAVANSGKKAEELLVEEILVGKSVAYRRRRPNDLGKKPSLPYRKAHANCRIELTELDG